MKLNTLFKQLYGYTHNFNVEQISQHQSNFHTTLITYGDSFGTIKDIPTNIPVDSIHILPFFEATSDGGFSVSNYQKVNKHMGNWQDIKELAKKTTIMADLVLNHVSASHEWFQSFLKLGKESPYADFFHSFEQEPDTSQVYRPRTSPLFTEFQTVDGLKKIWTTFSADQIDLNFSNPKVLFAILDILKLFIQHGITVIRLDAIGYAWKELGTPCFHHKKVYLLTELMREYVKLLNPNAMLVAEIHDKIEPAKTYLPVSDLIYDFRPPSAILYALKKQNAEELYNIQSSPRHFAVICTHDGTSLNGSHMRNEQKKEIIEGVVGMRDTPNGPAVYELTSSTRTLAKDGFYRAHAYLAFCFERIGVYYRNLYNVGDNTELYNKTKHHRDMNRGDIVGVPIDKKLAKTLELRRNTPALEKGTVTHIHIHPQIFACERKLNNRKLLVLINLGNSIELKEYIGNFDIVQKEKFSGILDEYSVLEIE